MRPLLAWLLLTGVALAQGGPEETVLWGVGQNRANRIKIVLVPDGWTRADLDRTETLQVPRRHNAGETDPFPPFDACCRTLVTALLEKEPFKTYRNMLWITSLKAPSEQSGVSMPSENRVVRTLFGCTYYDRDQVKNRGLKFRDDEAARARARELAPDADVVVCLVNDGNYIGAGTALGVNESGTSFVVMTPAHRAAPLTFIHEIGHALADLGDEYTDTDNAWTLGEPLWRNLTTYTEEQRVTKWKHWWGFMGVGAFPGGAQHRTGIYHPTQTMVSSVIGPEPRPNCCMGDIKTLPFCPVCTERIIQRFYETVDVIDAVDPPTGDAGRRGRTGVLRTPGATIRVTTVGPVSAGRGGHLQTNLRPEWTFGDDVSAGRTEVTSQGPVFTWTVPAGNHYKPVTLLIRDRTPYVRATPGTEIDDAVDPLAGRDRVRQPRDGDSTTNRHLGESRTINLRPVRREWRVDVSGAAGNASGLRTAAETR